MPKKGKHRDLRSRNYPKQNTVAKPFVSGKVSNLTEQLSQQLITSKMSRMTPVGGFRTQITTRHKRNQTGPSSQPQCARNCRSANINKKSLVPRNEPTASIF